MLTSLTTHYSVRNTEDDRHRSADRAAGGAAARAIRHHAGAAGMRKQNHLRPAIVTVFAVFVAMLPYITGNLYYLHVATVIGVYWVLIATLNLLVGFTGQLSVGHVGLLAIGAYAFCLLAGRRVGTPSSPAGGGRDLRRDRPCAGLAVVAIARILFRHGDTGLRADRQRTGTRRTVADQWQRRHAGAEFPAAIRHPWGFYWLVLGIAAFITWMTANLARFMWGRAMVALRDSTVAASSVAVPIYLTKLMVFVFSGFTAGIAGGLYATSQSYITPDAFIVNLGIYFFVAIIIGGRGRHHRPVHRRRRAGRHPGTGRAPGKIWDVLLRLHPPARRARPAGRLR